VLRGLGIAALTLLALVVGTYVASEWQLDRRIELPAAHASRASPPSRLADPARGEELARLALCITCHGEELSGTLQAESPLLGRLYSSNLTSGAGGVGSLYEYVDWERAIRHGIGPGGRALLLMPARTLNELSDEDLSDLIAFLRVLPAVDHAPPSTRLGPLLRARIALGMSAHLISSHQVDHDKPHRTAAPPREDVSHGAYLVDVASCRVCHGAELGGNPHPMELLGGPAPPKLLGPTRPSRWSSPTFVRAMRSGVLPSGDTMDPRFMPWPTYGALTDSQLRSIHQYLRQLDP